LITWSRGYDSKLLSPIPNDHASHPTKTTTVRRKKSLLKPRKLFARNVHVATKKKKPTPRLVPPLLARRSTRAKPSERSSETPPLAFVPLDGDQLRGLKRTREPNAEECEDMSITFHGLKRDSLLDFDFMSLQIPTGWLSEGD
jgi:hypothetical protein